MPKASEGEGFVLSLRPYQESDLLVGIYAREFGKQTFFAKSGRASRRRFSGLDLFVEGQFQASTPSRSGSGLSFLQSFTVQHAHWELRRDFETLALASYVSELIWLTAAEGEVSEDVYQLLTMAFEKLKQSSRALSPAWEMSLLETLGFGMDRQRCGICQGHLDAQAASLDLQGRWLCDACHRQEGSVVRMSAEARALLASQPEAMDPSTSRRIRWALSHHFESLLERKLKTRSVLKDAIYDT